MEIFALLERDYYECSCGMSEYNQYYRFHSMLTRDELTLFLEQNNYKYNSTYQKIMDYAGFEKFKVEIKAA